ncbi:MAG: fused MFS/spermidine synthase [Peptococcaceae bacterium]|nr:fused MFS/spermidine synthase [Peptococcaceae bacterium]
MSVMAVEIGASRLLAPYFSSSQIVWTIIIGTIMIALALGNVFGGRWADANPDPGRLFRRIMLAAVWIAAIPILGRYVIVAITGILVVAVETNLLIWAAFVTCMIVFVFPLFLLGTVTPSLIKFTVSSLDESGRIAGRLGACNTIGSILGTFLPTFVTIPAVGTAVSFMIFSGVLLVLALVYFITTGGWRKGCTIATAVFLVCSILAGTVHFAFWERELTYEGESIYNYLQVKDTDQATILSTNVLFGVQSMRVKDDGLTHMYYDTALAAPVMAALAEKDHPRVLVLGMGTGTFASQVARYFPNAEVSGVEIDARITDLAHEYFALPESVPVATYDGRAYLAADSGKYDVIMVDAYQDITIPFQMSSVEFFDLVKSHLTADGVMVCNLNMRGQGEDDIAAWLCDTIASVFPEVAVADVDGSYNREVFATVHGAPRERLQDNLASVTDFELANRMRQVRSAMTRWQAGEHILTDDKAPVELLGMRTIDGMISAQIGYYKEILRRDGLDGLLASL